MNPVTFIANPMKSSRKKEARGGGRAHSSDPLLAGLESLSRGRGRFGGRGVVVTGAATGIGRAIAIAFAREGARVVALDIDAPAGAKTLDLVKRHSPRSEFLRADLRDPDAVKEAAGKFIGGRGADILVNNAASIGRTGPAHLLEESDCESVLRTNVLGPFQLSRLAARAMIDRGAKGTIINILTIQTGSPVPGYSAYVTSKGAADAMTLALAVDLAPFGIRVNGIRVGSVLTENFLRVLPERLKGQMDAKGGGPDLEVLDNRAATLLGRMGRPAEIAKVALFLASDDAGFMTGSVVRVDGGRSISRKVEPLL